jgi:hypothetical protein
MTFAKLEGFHTTSAGNEACPLDQWYNSVREIDIEMLDEGDLARCFRQNLWPQYIIDIALTKLELNPMAGWGYDGDLLVSLRFLPPKFWSENQAARMRAVNILHLVDTHNADSELIDDLAKLRYILTESK